MDRRFQTPVMSDSDTESVSSGVSSIASTPLAEAYANENPTIDDDVAPRIKSRAKVAQKAPRVKAAQKAPRVKATGAAASSVKRKSKVQKALAHYGKTHKRENPIQPRKVMKDGKEVMKKIKVRHLDDHFIFKMRTIKQLMHMASSQAIATNAASILATRIAMMFTKICNEAERLAALTGKKTVLAEHVRHAIDSLFPGLRKANAFDKGFSSVIDYVISNQIRLRFARIARLCKHRGESERFADPGTLPAEPSSSSDTQVAETYISKKHLFRWSNRGYRPPALVKQRKGKSSSNVFREAQGVLQKSAIALLTETLLRYTLDTITRAVAISRMNMKESGKFPRISARHVMAALSME